MRLDVPFCDETAEARAPRIGLVVGHSGLRDDLERALVSAGCRVIEPASTVDAVGGDSFVVETETPGADAFVVEAETPGAERFARMRSAVVWLVDSAKPAQARAATGRVVLAKPFSVADLEHALEQALEPARDAVERLDAVLRSEEPRMRNAVERARRLAEQDRGLVIQGELGVGRQALARATHDWSARAGAPFVILDRLDLTSAPIEEALQRIDAAWSEAKGGTLVAIEPAEWALAAQFALARALREGALARLVTIASVPLEDAVERDRLPRELADRLDVSRIVLPSFRERPADHRALCEAVARRVARRLGRETPAIEQAQIDEWAAEGFPGNLLGLESRLRAAMLRAEVELAGRGPDLTVERHAAVAASLDLKALERETIVRALAHWQGNRTRASESLGISVRTLRNKIREYGLR